MSVLVCVCCYKLCVIVGQSILFISVIIFVIITVILKPLPDS